MKLHGNTLIQLFDAKTGKETDRIEKHNILTLGADSVVNGCPYGFDRRTWEITNFTPGTNWNNIFSKLFGGLIVFPNNLTEDAAEFIPSMDASDWPVAYASMDGQDTSDAKTGTYNGIESGPITNGFRYVYDFGTSQGNGAWRCLSLTSSKAGYSFFGSDNWLDSYAKRVPTSGTKDYVIGLTESHIYVGSWNGAIYRFEAHPYNIDLVHNDIMGTTLEDTGITFDGYVYIDFDNNELIKITGTSTLTISVYDLTDLTDPPTVSTLALGEAVSAPSVNGNLFVEMDGYYYIPSHESNNTKVYKINSSNGSDMTVLTCPTVGNNPRALGKMEKCVHGMNCFITPDDSVISSPFILNASDVAGNRIIHQFGAWLIHSRGDYYFNDYSYYASIFTPYLATINNLVSPVTKDASKTAKITYELTAVEES